MFNFKKTPVVLSVTLSCWLGIATLAHTEERRLVGTTSGSLLEGPGAQYKVIKPLQNAQSFEVLETLNDFVRIRTQDGTEGWLQESFTEAQTPAVPTSGDSNEKAGTPATKPREKLPPIARRPTTQLSESANDFQPRKEYSEQPPVKDVTEMKKLQTALDEITEKFKELETTSVDAEQLKTENEKLQAELSAMQNSTAQLQLSNSSLKQKQNIYWFLAGSAVFFLGWLLGRISFRRQRHSSLTL